ncbi:lytic transglycosylase domain-containing protein [Gluconobacter cerinus]|uniref:lytic transglycosylase domain-containing protein n=1 Tax=Gluconobacter cerinus TaxID=38307 RepID=UPI001B8DA699|nr:lytic transglycosylase domain-containing protein [Gluconobacter cerinus]MBS0984276.1 lytic transglycosylase domain-containing protein [Gluconobacter cerinus]
MILTAFLLTQLVTQCAPGDAPETLQAVASVESGFNTLAINDNTTRERYAPASEADAVATANRLLAAGHSVDLGLMQINSKNLPSLGLSVPDAFNACQSIRAGARVLRDGYQSALRVAFSRYNTGSDTKGFANGYVKKVLEKGGLIPDLHGRVVVSVGHVADNKTPHDVLVAPVTEPHTIKDMLHGTEMPEAAAADAGPRSLNLFSDLSAAVDQDEKTAPHKG